MPVSEFSFTVRLNDEPHFESMLMALVSGVLSRTGVGPKAASEVTASVRSELESGAAAGLRECSVHFLARGGQLEVVVGYRGTGEWRTACRLR